MSDKKIYAVDVEVRLTMLVAAESEVAANELGLNHYKEDIKNDGDPYAVEIGSRLLKSCPAAAQGVIPWGIEEDDPRHDWTVKQWFEEKA